MYLVNTLFTSANMFFEIGSTNSLYEFLLNSSIADQSEHIKMYKTVLSLREFSIRQKKCI